MLCVACKYLSRLVQNVDVKEQLHCRAFVGYGMWDRL